MSKRIWAKNQLRRVVRKARKVIASTSSQTGSDSRAPKKKTRASSSGTSSAPSSTSQSKKSGSTGASKVRFATVGDLKFELHDDHAVLVKCNNLAATEVEIPKEVENRPVTVIGKRAFKDCTHLTEVSIPLSVTELQRSAFEGCTAIERMELPSDVEVIGGRAFANCRSLKEIILPFELKRIGDSAFENCVSLVGTPHFIKQGLGAVMTVGTELERNLPIAVKKIGKSAFKNCSKLEFAAVPYRATEIHESTFENCTGLKEVLLHSHLTSIEDRAFAGCSSLQSIRIPGHTTLGKDNVFDSQTTVLTEPNSVASEGAEKLSLQVQSVTANNQQTIDSAFDSNSELTINDFVDSDAFNRTFISQYEIRPPAREADTPTEYPATINPQPSRFALKNGVYSAVAPQSNPTNEITISMTGDLMCVDKQQTVAKRNGSYDFSSSFKYLEPIFKASDLTVGNLETMVSRSHHLQVDTPYTDDRAHFNSPKAFLTAVRNAGYDIVTNAQNHMYDTGATGMFETLAAMNDSQLLHTGMFASANESRTLVIEINGIRIAMLAYLDPARQKHKQANLTDEAVKVLANPFDQETIAADVKTARGLGAEFVIAFCHWGREYTRFITDRQNNFARMVANAGVDYIFGSHSHCPQHYDVIKTADDRLVPVVYSGGNFISARNLKPPHTLDTFIGQLTLARNSAGTVEVKDEGYIPCRIVLSGPRKGRTKTIPCELLEQGVEGYDPLEAKEDIQRIQWTMGKQYPMKRLAKTKLSTTVKRRKVKHV